MSVGFISGYATSSSIGGWYSQLNKPFFNPPNWIFGPVWTVLYILMGISAGIIWSSAKKIIERKKELIAFGIQLFFNFLWSILFFGYQNPTLALIDIILLLVLIIYTIKLFEPINKVSSWLLYPYLGWVSFATILNLSIVLLN